MAIDTRNKRSSSIAVGSPWRCQTPAPDGALGQADRQQYSWSYSGILADVPAPDVTPHVIPATSGTKGSGPGYFLGEPGRKHHFDDEIAKERERRREKDRDKPKEKEVQVKKKHVKNLQLAMIDEDLALIDSLRMD